jgi:hypothetical protein
VGISERFLSMGRWFLSREGGFCQGKPDPGFVGGYLVTTVTDMLRCEPAAGLKQHNRPVRTGQKNSRVDLNMDGQDLPKLAPRTLLSDNAGHFMRTRKFSRRGQAQRRGTVNDKERDAIADVGKRSESPSLIITACKQQNIDIVTYSGQLCNNRRSNVQSV